MMKLLLNETLIDFGRYGPKRASRNDPQISATPRSFRVSLHQCASAL